VDADDAAHQFDQALGDREPQAGAAEAPGRAAIRLHELLENHLLARLGNPMPVSSTSIKTVAEFGVCAGR